VVGRKSPYALHERGLVMDATGEEVDRSADQAFIKGPATLHVGLPASAGR
jgi:hypothetical protein